MLLEVPYHRQKEIYTCGPAALKMVYGFFGKKTKERYLARELKTTKDGTKNSDLIKSARRKGFYCFVHDNSSVEEIKHFITKNLPVIVNYIEPRNNDGHYAVVVGFKKKKLVLNDSWNGENFKISIRKFNERWHSSNYNPKRWMMVISKKKFNLEK